jgi:hypothetical protein
MSDLKVDGIIASTGTNTALTLQGKGSGKVDIGDGALSFPDADGSDGEFIKTDGSGALSFAAAGGGKILQVVQTILTATFSTTSTTYTDVTGLTVSITPANSSNKILVSADVHFEIGTTNTVFAAFRGMRDSTALAVGDAASSRIVHAMGSGNYDNQSLSHTGMMWLDSPSSTSSIAYHIETKGYGGGQTVYVNRSYTDADNTSFGRAISQITVMEVDGT